MKKTFSLTLLLTLLTIGAKSQIKNGSYYSKDHIHLFPDSIRVEFPQEQAFVIFELKEYEANHTFIDNFSSSLKDMIFYIKKTSADKDFAMTPHLARVVVGNENEKEIEVTATKETSTKLTVKNNLVAELLPPGWEITIRLKGGKIYVYGKNLESIEKIAATDFSMVTAKIKGQTVQPFERKGVKARMIVREGMIENADVELKHPGDFLIGQAGIGFGFVSDAFYPTLGTSVALIFRDRFGRKNHMVKLNLDYMLFNRKLPDGNPTVASNLATSLSYGWNFAKSSGGDRWVALGIGAVSNQSSGNIINDKYFRGNTMRVFASFDLINNFSLIPELFLTDNVNNKIYGLRLNFTLP